MIDGWVTGVDVSGAQRPSRCVWSEAKDAGLDFAIVKLSEGQDYQDAAAREHIQNITAAGIPLGVYHVARPDNRFLESSDGRRGGEREALWLLRCLGELPRCARQLPPALDFEKYTKGKSVTKAQRGAFARELVRIVKMETGRAPIVYTGDDYWRGQMPPDLADELRADGCPLWLVDYTSAPDPRAKEVIEGWPWSIWQWSGGGNFAHAQPMPGLPHPIDRNRYRGSLAELRGLITGASHG